MAGSGGQCVGARIEAGRLVAVEVRKGKASGVILLVDVLGPLVLAAELERVFAPDPEQRILDRRVTQIVFKIARVDAAPACRRIVAGEGSLQKGVLRVARRQTLEPAFRRPFIRRSCIRYGNKEALLSKTERVDHVRGDRPKMLKLQYGRDLFDQSRVRIRKGQR